MLLNHFLGSNNLSAFELRHVRRNSYQVLGLFLKNIINKLLSKAFQFSKAYVKLFMYKM